LRSAINSAESLDQLRDIIEAAFFAVTDHDRLTPLASD
jgi:hypothetical protein